MCPGTSWGDLTTKAISTSSQSTTPSNSQPTKAACSVAPLSKTDPSYEPFFHISGTNRLPSTLSLEEAYNILRTIQVHPQNSIPNLNKLFLGQISNAPIAKDSPLSNELLQGLAKNSQSPLSTKEAIQLVRTLYALLHHAYPAEYADSLLKECRIEYKFSEKLTGCQFLHCPSEVTDLLQSSSVYIGRDALFLNDTTTRPHEEFKQLFLPLKEALPGNVAKFPLTVERAKYSAHLDVSQGSTSGILPPQMPMGYTPAVTPASADKTFIVTIPSLCTSNGLSHADTPQAPETGKDMYRLGMSLEELTTEANPTSSQSTTPSNSQPTEAPYSVAPLSKTDPLYEPFFDISGTTKLPLTLSLEEAHNILRAIQVHPQNSLPNLNKLFLGQISNAPIANDSPLSNELLQGLAKNDQSLLSTKEAIQLVRTLYALLHRAYPTEYADSLLKECRIEYKFSEKLKACQFLHCPSEVTDLLQSSSVYIGRDALFLNDTTTRPHEEFKQLFLPLKEALPGNVAKFPLTVERSKYSAHLNVSQGSTSGVMSPQMPMGYTTAVTPASADKTFIVTIPSLCTSIGLSHADTPQTSMTVRVGFKPTLTSPNSQDIQEPKTKGANPNAAPWYPPSNDLPW